MSVVADWFVQVAVLLSAAAATSAVTAAAGTWLVVRRHDRALFGEEDLADGLVDRVREHQRVLEEEDLL